ncbi:hypothetical protein CYMTET_7695 [Cymbomonas tetramitiformis]|uniref:Uncharacterized protein n=1 Tax=Cymbomonas tetramitiformis TaxID=36881 RepID=A0AAE0GV52_9CHLO|nr:hypothetical protein CYMTET_7695 [Cymbomonas tetramitiformis]
MPPRAHLTEDAGAIPPDHDDTAETDSADSDELTWQFRDSPLCLLWATLQIGGSCPETVYVNYHCIFAVTKAQIRNRSRDFYISLQKWIDKNPDVNAKALEVLWMSVFDYMPGDNPMPHEGETKSAKTLTTETTALPTASPTLAPRQAEAVPTARTAAPLKADAPTISNTAFPNSSSDSSINNATIDYGLRRVALWIAGGSFRAHSHQHSSEYGGAEAVSAQHEASKSHVDIVIGTLMIRLNVTEVDVFIHTYKTNDTESLKDWYAPYLRYLHPYSLSQQDQFWPGRSFGAGHEVVHAIPSYDGVLFIRPDLIFKPYMVEAMLHAQYDKLLLPFLEWGIRLWNKHQTSVKVADTLMWIPGKFLNSLPIFKNMPQSFGGWVINHNVLEDRAFKHIPQHMIDFFLPGEYHDADPEKDWNPIYSYAARAERLPETAALERVKLIRGW